MKTTIFPFVAPRRGLDLSRPGDLIDDSAMTNCRNVRFKAGYVQTRDGYEQMGLNVLGTPNGLFEYEDLSGTRRLWLFTTTGAYLWNTTEEQWVWRLETAQQDACDEDSWAEGDGGTNVTCSLEETIAKENNKSVKVAIADGFTTGLAAYHNGWDDEDWTDYDKICFWFRSSVDLTAGQLRIRISDDANGGTSGDYVDCDLPAVTADQWTYCALSGDFSELDSVSSIGIVVVTDTGACNLYIDDVRTSAGFANGDSATDYWSCCVIRDLGDDVLTMLAVNHRNDVMYSQEGGELAGLNGAHAQGGETSDVGTLDASFIVNFKGYPILGDVTDSSRYYQRLQWPDTQDINEWNEGNYGYVDLDQADRIVALLPYRNDYLAIVRENSIWLAWATGESNNSAFDPDLKISGIGSPAGRTCKVINDKLYFMGFDNIYMFDGVRCDPIGNPIADGMFGNINNNTIARSFALVRQEDEEYWVFVPSTGATNPDTVWVYNYRLGAWTRHDLADTMVVACQYMIDATMTIDDLAGAIDDLGFRFDDRRTTLDAPAPILADSSGYIWRMDPSLNDDDDAAVDAFFETKDFNLTGMVVQQFVNRLDVVWRGESLKIFYSVDKGLTWQQAGSLDARSNLGRDPLWFRATGDFIRFKFRNDSALGYFRFDRANMFWQPAGRIAV